MLFAVASAAQQFRGRAIDNSLMSEFSMDREAYETALDSQIREISEMDFGEFMTISGFSLQNNPMQKLPAEKYRLGITYLRHSAPSVVARTMFDVVVLFVAAVYFLLLFSRGSQSAYEAARRLPATIFPMMGLILWMLLRSFLWIPFVGPLIALYMVPRLSLAPVILAGGEAGIFQSLNLSMKRTSGNWRAIFFRLFLIIVISLLILWPLLVIVVGASLFSVKIGFILLALAVIFIIAYQCAALTVLAVMMA